MKLLPFLFLLLIGTVLLTIDYGLIKAIISGLKYGFSTRSHPDGDNVLGVLFICSVLIFFLLQVRFILKIAK